MSERSNFFALSRTHDDIALDVIRAFLGVALFIRGILFISDSSRILALVQTGQMDYLVPALLLYAAILAHIMGGLMLAVGLLTRIGALIQIPVLIGAVYIAIIQGGLFLPDQSLELSSLVLVVLAIFFVFGSGPYSLDRVIFKPGAAEEAEARDRAASSEYRSMVSDWANKRSHITRESTGKTADGAYISAGSWLRLATVVRYAFVFGVAGVLMYFAIRSLPVEVSAAEIGAVGGILFLILGVFFLIFGWALKDEDEAQE